MSRSRACGTCTACCMALGVRELSKPPYQRCSNTVARGCGVYADRPRTCQVYACEWLAGLGLRHHRPDRVGLIVDRTAPSHEVQDRADAGDAGAQREVQAARSTVRVREVRPGALKERRGKELAEWLHGQGLTVVLVPFGGRRLPAGRPL